MQQRPEQLTDGDVEADLRLLQEPVGAVEAVRVLHREQAIDDSAMGVEDSLRSTRRARRVDDVGEIVGADRRPRDLRCLDRRSSASPRRADTVGPRIEAGRGSSDSTVTSTSAFESASMNSNRSAGSSGSSGTYAPPAFRMARRPTTSSSDRSRLIATTDSEPTPTDWRCRASWFARALSSAYVSRSSSNTTARASGERSHLCFDELVERKLRIVDVGGSSRSSAVDRVLLPEASADHRSVDPANR